MALRGLLAFAQSDTGLILLVGIPVVLLILSDAWGVIRTNRVDRPNTGESGIERLKRSSASEHHGAASAELRGSRSADDWLHEKSDFPPGNPSSFEHSAPEEGTSSSQRTITSCSPEVLTSSQLAAELRTIAELSAAERREYEQRGYDIEGRERALYTEVDERLTYLRMLQQHISEYN